MTAVVRGGLSRSSRGAGRRRACTPAPAPGAVDMLCTRRLTVSSAPARKLVRPCAFKDPDGAPAPRDWLNPARVLPMVLAGVVSLAPLPADAAQRLHAASEALYEQQIHRKTPAVSHLRSSSSSRENAAALRGYDSDLFTPDAWAGMLRLQRYAEYVEGLTAAGAESAPGCEACTSNRLMLEKAWQVVANEYYDSGATFSQAKWAEALQQTLQAHGGALRTTRDAYAALADLVSALHDPYSSFLPPSQFRAALRRPQRAERNYLEAQYVGVGLHFGELAPDGGRVIAAPMAESPAEGAGLQRGDEVLEVEGVPASALTIDELTTLLRGPAGSAVELTVAQRGGRVRPLVLERQRLPQPPVREARLPLPDGRSIAYLRLHYFSGEGTAALARAVVAAEQDGVAGYVLDLRNNPGGVFEEAVAAASLFLEPAQRVALTVRSGGPNAQPPVIDTTWTAGSLGAAGLGVAGGSDALALPGPLTNRPLVLLVNRSSASASEVLAGALHDHGRALLLGEKTFGKGVVQFYFPLADGSGVKLTVAKYLTPSQYDIARSGGLSPDTPCSDYPHGVLTKGTADRCVLGALTYLQAAPPGLDITRIDPLYASR